MKKMIFLASACTLVSSLFCSVGFADPAPKSTDAGLPGNPIYDADVDTSGTTTKNTAAMANNTTAPAKKAKKKRKKHTYKVPAYAVMKDEPPAPATSSSWLDHLSGNMTLASNYMWRGISQTENLPAVQGGLTYEFPIGLYFNVWGSNVKFPETDATVELDATAGWRGEPITDFTYDLSFARYYYPSARYLNYNEFNSVFNYKIIQVGYSYSANVCNVHAPGRYYLLGLNYDLPPQYVLNIEDLSVHGTVGHYTLPRAAGNSYNDYSAWLSKRFHKNYIITGQWTTTNGRQHNSPYDSTQYFALLTAEF